MAEAAARRKPGWLTIPGGPKEPNRTEFVAKLQALSAEKSQCFEELKAIRDQFDAGNDDPTRKVLDDERKQLRGRLTDIDDARKTERSARKTKDDEIRKVRDQRREIEQQLRELSDEIGAFNDLSEIDLAIDRVLYKMETGSGELKAEKLCAKRLSALEQAKSLILRLQPLSEAIAEAEEQEAELQREYREIHVKIQELNKDYEGTAAEKIAKDKEGRKGGVDRTALKAQREKVRERLDRLNKQLDELRSGFDKQKEVWEAWKVEAQAKWRAQEEEKFKERDRRRKEAEQRRRAGRLAAKLAKRRNPYEKEIDDCAMLIKYLNDKVVAAKQDKERTEHAKKIAAFDPMAFVPTGAKLAHTDDNDDWLFGDRTGKNKKAAAPQKAQKKPADKKAQDANTKAENQRSMHHSVDKCNIFSRVGVEPPLAFGQVDAAVAALQKKKEEFESHIQNVDEVSTEDDEAEEDNSTAAAAEAPAAEAKAE